MVSCLQVQRLFRYPNSKQCFTSRPWLPWFLQRIIFIPLPQLLVSIASLQLCSNSCIPTRWKPFDPARNFPDLGPRFKATEDIAHASLRQAKIKSALAAQKTGTTAGAGNKKGGSPSNAAPPVIIEQKEPDKVDLDWSTVLKRTFEGYIRGERPNMYGEWIQW